MDELSILRAQVVILERKVAALTRSFFDLWADVEILAAAYRLQEIEDEVEEST